MKSDPGYLKAYYRRAAAHMSLGKFKLALSDFELVSKRRPNDSDAKKKFIECNKIVKKMAFERAIAVDRPEKTLAEMYQSLESISIEDDYDGPKLEGEKNVTLEFMNELMQHYKDQKKLHKKYAYKVRRFEIWEEWLKVWQSFEAWIIFSILVQMNNQIRFVFQIKLLFY